MHILKTALVTAGLAAALAIPASATATDWTNNKTFAENLSHLTATNGGLLGVSDSEGGPYAYPLTVDGSPSPTQRAAGIGAEAFGADGLATFDGVCNHHGTTLTASLQTATNGPVTTQTLSSAACGPLASDGNARGDLAVVSGYESLDANKKPRPGRSLWLRTAGSKRFIRALRMPVRKNAQETAVALGARGDVLVAWENGAVNGLQPPVYARYRTPGGTWLPVERLGGGDPQETPGSLQVGLTGEGRRVVIWHRKYTVPTFASAIGTQRFAQQPRFAVEEDGGPSLLATPEHGDPILVSIPGYGGPRTVRVARVVDGSPTTHVQTITLPDLAGTPTLKSAAVADNGAAVVTWSVFLPGAIRENQRAIMASTRAAGATAFSDAQVLAVDGWGGDSAISPDGTRAYVAYTAGGEGFSRLAVAKP